MTLCRLALVGIAGSTLLGSNSAHAQTTSSIGSALDGIQARASSVNKTDPGLQQQGVVKVKENYSSPVATYKCDPFDLSHPGRCTSSTPEQSVAPSATERLIIDAAMIGAQDGSKIFRDPKSYFLQKTTSWAASQATDAINKGFQKIPFLAQTTIGMDQTNGSAGSFYLDSFMKLATLGKDDDGATKGIVFSQARWSGAWGVSGSTINTGLGARYRVGSSAMVGVNGFWDYRMVQYATSYSRFGVGVEGFWKDLELRNNWYISGTGTKAIGDTAATITYERVVPGWDVELGYRLPRYPQLSFYVKGFLWDYVSRQNNSGVGGGINWQATPNVNLEVSVSNEIPAYLTYAPSNNNDNVYFGARLKYSFNKVKYAPKNYRQNMLTNMVQPVRRRYDVLLERYTKSKSNGAFSVQVSGI